MPGMSSRRHPGPQELHQSYSYLEQRGGLLGCRHTSLRRNRGAANRNERPLVNTACARLLSLACVSHRWFAVLQPAPLPNSGEALSLPLFVHAHAGIPPDARLVLQLVAWSAVEVRICRLKLDLQTCRELS